MDTTCSNGGTGIEQNCNGVTNNYFCSTSCTGYDWIRASSSDPGAVCVGSGSAKGAQPSNIELPFGDKASFDAAPINDMFKQPLSYYESFDQSCNCKGSVATCTSPGTGVLESNCAVGVGGTCTCKTSGTCWTKDSRCSIAPQPICQRQCMSTPQGWGLEFYQNSLGSPFNTYYKCGVPDGVCPDDFALDNQCGAVNGICAKQGITDPDCVAPPPSTSCNVTSVSIGMKNGCVNGVCTAGDNLTASVVFSGTSCSLANITQVDFYTTTRSCVIQYSGTNMKGITQTMPPYGFLNNGKWFLNFDYTIPSIPDACAGAVLSNATAALWTNIPGTARSNFYSQNPPESITLDQCKQFGISMPYFLQPFYTVIQNASTSCFTHTCFSYDAIDAITFTEASSTPPITGNVVASDKITGNVGSGLGGGTPKPPPVTYNYGVSLWNYNTLAYQKYYCGVNDSICPDDFQYQGSCMAVSPTGGICANHSIRDYDCSVRIKMKCGLSDSESGSIVPVCDVPVPTPEKDCGAYTDACVYARDNATPPQCYYNSAGFVSNTLPYNLTLRCIGKVGNKLTNVWCPDGWTFNPALLGGQGKCLPPFQVCGPGTNNCQYAGTLSTHTIQEYVDNPVLRADLLKYYMNNSTCFLNTTSFRRNKYCGVVTWLPLKTYGYLPVSVVRDVQPGPISGGEIPI
jgi:hypothetical protein